LQHESGLAALHAGLTALVECDREVAEAITLKGGRYFAALETGEIVLFDSDNTPAIGTQGQYIDPGTAAAQALEKLEASAKPTDTGLKAWGRDNQGRVIVPRSQSLDRRSVQANLPIEDFDAGNWMIVDDSKLGTIQPETVAKRLQQAQSSKRLEIKTSELPAARDWCRKNDVDVQQFDSLIHANKIKVVAG
jgi:hypothetical protein